jgi:hypothetical protein
MRRIFAQAILSMALFSMALFAAPGAFLGTASAAELAVAPRVAAVAPAVTQCGCRCGCLAVTYVRHRQLEMSYGYLLDPRQRDEPRYFWGRTRNFARYQTVVPVHALD